MDNSKQPVSVKSASERTESVAGGLHRAIILGLAISRDLARAMDGELTVVSHLGQGVVLHAATAAQANGVIGPLP